MKKAVSIATGAAMFFSAVPAFAFGGSIDVGVTNKDTTVTNVVGTSASTGWNSSNGGSATTNLKNSGNVNGNKDDYNTTGGGVVSSAGGNGGTVTTGNASAKSGVSNDVNGTTVKVTTSCGCRGNIDVSVKNKRTDVANLVTTLADTGANVADGGSASTKVKDSGSINGNKDDHNTTGAGTVSSDGGNGGTITTGDAWAKSKVTNTVNSTVVRVHRI